MFKIEDGIMLLTCGDDAAIPVTLKIRGEAYEMQDGDRLTLTVQKFGETEPAFVETTDTNVITIAHADTCMLPCGKYDADIQLDTWDGKKYTVFPDRRTLNEKQLLGIKALENFWICREVTCE